MDRKVWSTSEQPYRPVRKRVSIQTNRRAILPAAFRLLAVALGGLHTWAAISRFSMNPDGIAYLDMADAYMRGDWRAAVVRRTVWEQYSVESVLRQYKEFISCISTKEM